MPSVVKPLTVFHKTIVRASALISLRETELETPEPDDLIRAAVIISIAGFDRYFTAKYCDILIPYLKSGEKVHSDLYNSLQNAGLDAKFALELLAAKRPYRKIRTIVQNSLSQHTTHRDDKIDELFLRIGLKFLCKNAESMAGRKTLVTGTMKLVNIRNEIAHEAHVQVNGKTRKISASEITSRISDMQLFVESCDKLIDNAFGLKPAN
jgi:HEPN superfamily RiboL-PSP-like protein